MNIQDVLIVTDDKETSSLQVGYFLLSKAHPEDGATVLPVK